MKKIISPDKTIRLFRGDCIDVMKRIPDKYVDLILCDLPYGTTSCSWDVIIPFDELWVEYLRIAKDNTPIVLFGSHPFSAFLLCSNPKHFRHSWIYKKRCASNFAQAKYAPMKEHEDVLVFSKNKANYYPIKEERTGGGASRVKYKFTENSRHKTGEFVTMNNGEFDATASDLRFPSSVQEFNNRAVGDRGFHPTQKPVALLEYLIKTYSLKNDIVLDNTMGSGSTGVAAVNLQRKFIGIEQDENYYDIAVKRIKESYKSCK